MLEFKAKAHIRGTEIYTENVGAKEHAVYIQMVIPEPFASQILKKGELDKIGFVTMNIIDDSTESHEKATYMSASQVVVSVF